MISILYRFSAAVILAGILGACTFLKDTTTPEAQKKAEPEQKIPAAEGRRYRVVTHESLMEILVYRGGKLARLGHNHVVACRNLEGSVFLADEIHDSRVELRFPVASLIVDEPDLRRKAGDEFKKVPNQSDIRRTRENMLSERTLDANRFPQVNVTAKIAGGQVPDLELDATLSLHGRTRPLRIPVKLDMVDQRLTAEGEFRIRQTEFGITPYSVLMGALKVKDELVVRYRIIARESRASE